jgi:hypothetical protein
MVNCSVGSHPSTVLRCFGRAIFLSSGQLPQRWIRPILFMETDGMNAGLDLMSDCDVSIITVPWLVRSPYLLPSSSYHLPLCDKLSRYPTTTLSCHPPNCSSYPLKPYVATDTSPINVDLRCIYDRKNTCPPHPTTKGQVDAVRGTPTRSTAPFATSVLFQAPNLL